MTIKFLPRESEPTEAEMGQYLFFYDQFLDECDAISVSANATGFTPLTTISGVLSWDRDMINQFATEVNTRGEVGVNINVSPKLLLVPHVLNNKPQHKLAEDLFQACNAIKAKTLRFTHYGLILGTFPKEQIKSIMQYIVEYKDDLSLDKIYWEVDEKYKQEINELWNGLREPITAIE
jgi:hypothetical protein